MAHQFEFTVQVTVERMEGKFATRDEMTDALTEALDDAMGNVDLSCIGPDGDSQYEVTDHSVNYEGK